MTIDTAIRHVTKPHANLFLELGFAPIEAKRLQAASRKDILGHDRSIGNRLDKNCLALADRTARSLGQAKRFVNAA